MKAAAASAFLARSALDVAGWRLQAAVASRAATDTPTSAGLAHAKFIATFLKRFADFLGMPGVAGLDHDVELRALGRHVQRQPVVHDVDDICLLYTSRCV